MSASIDELSETTISCPLEDSENISILTHDFVVRVT